MVIAPLLESTQHRLAQHYLNKLRQAGVATRYGRINIDYWLKQIQDDWDQIKQWQAWAASGAEADPERAQLCIAFPLAISSFLRIRQSPAETLVWLQQALKAAQELDDDAAQRELLHLVCMMHWNLENAEAVGQFAEQLARSAEVANDTLGLNRAWSHLGRVKEFRDDYDGAEVLYLRSLEHLVRYGEDNDLRSVWQGLGRIALRRGDYPLAYDYHVKILKSAIAAGKDGQIGVAHLSLSGIHNALRNYSASEEHAQQAVMIARRLGFTRLIPATLLSLAHAQKWLGKYESARLHYDEALAERSILNPSSVISGLHGLGQTCFLQGDFEKAFANFDEALQIAREKRILFRLCEVLPDRVMVQVARLEMGEARTSLHELVSGALQIGTPPYLAQALAAAVVLWQHSHAQEQAAVWAGLLLKSPEHLHSSLFDTAIFEQLETELGLERYQRAVQQGKKLSLYETVAELLPLLEPHPKDSTPS